MLKSRGPCTLILLPAPGAKSRQLTLPRIWPVLVGLLGLLSIGSSLIAGRRVRAWHDAEASLGASASAMAARDRAQWNAYLAERFPAFQASRPGPSDAELAAHRLRLFDINRERALTISPFLPDGSVSPHAFAALRDFMRCRRTGHTMDMDPSLVRLLLRISQRFEGAELQIISAHRAVDGVVTSETSQHGKGTASDIRVAGVPVEMLAGVAKAEGARGVGIYMKNRFVHVDVREKPYFWREESSVEDDLPLETDSGEAEAEAAPSVPADPVALAAQPALDALAPGALATASESDVTAEP